MKRIGILGGTFDPPHIGHLIIAEEVKNNLNLEEVWFIPTYEPPHKQNATIGVEHRLEMLYRALEGNASFKINTIEVERSGKSYTFDTMELLTNEYRDTEFFFIIGGDMVEYLPKWYKIDELIKMVRFIGVKRPGSSFSTEYPVREVTIPMIDISSTLIRERLYENKSVRYLVPDGVNSYIKENHLYEK